MRRGREFGACFLLAAGALAARAELLPNGGFEAGEASPAGWEMPQGGAWAREDGIGGGACVSVSGDGKTDGAWQSAAVAFQPNHLYRLSFNVRGEETGGGTVVSGPGFANVDIGVPGREWTYHANVFATPLRKDELTVPVRLGHWQMKGTAFFDDVRLAAVEAVHRHIGEVALGEGERAEGTGYVFEAPLGSECRNHSRPLLGFTARFNTDRWCFSEGQSVTYRHALAGRKMLAGGVEVTSGYFVSGRLLVEASQDMREWQPVGMLTNAGTQTMALPTELFPAEAVFVRLRGAKPPCTVQVHAYRFEGTFDGEPLQAAGSTRYVETEARLPRVRVQVTGLGDAVPGGDNFAELRALNATGAAMASEARVVFSRPGEAARTNAVAVTLPAGGAFEVRVPYEVPGVGTWDMAVELGEAFAARSSVTVPTFYDDSYGELLPSGNPKVSLWRASSGWKIPRSRPLPRQVAKALAMRVAKNEWEATQLVVTPGEALTNVRVTVGDLVYGRNRIPRENVRVWRVGYVPVTRKTDKTGTLADWPDPLLPQGGVTLEAGANQPYWIKVKAPKDAPEGIYRGTVMIEADGVKVSTVLNVEVFGFALPDTMTCETAFGFSPATVWRYHGVSDPAQKREVLDKYLRKLADNRISPYNPAPMEKWTVEWKGMNPWRGGVIDTREVAEGKGALFIDDASETANVSAIYPHALALPEKGFKIAFKHKTTKGQRFLFSLSYSRADGTWMPGCNTDIAVQGADTWQAFETVHAAFPAGAASARIAVYAAGYQEPGVATGGLWLDALSVVDLDTGKGTVEGGAFEPVDLNAVTPVFDWAAWDAAMERAFVEYHFNSFMIHVDGLGGGTFHERYEPVFLGYKGGTEAYEILIGKYLKGIEDHLREKGWLDKAYVYWFDEPDPKDYAFVMGGFDTLKRHAPGLRRMLTEQVEPELAGGPNLWCPLTPSLNVAGTEERRAAGDRFWWYVCCDPKAPYATEFIDHPGTEMRVWLWQTWAERVSGILIWETVYWTSDTAYPDRERPQNPYLDPMSWVVGYGVPPGTKQPWGNGDGRFLYPPLAAADGRAAAPVLDGPVGSIRLEMLRDGVEDYEYFVILKRLLAEKGQTLDPRTRANMEALLTVPAEVSSSLTQFTRDPSLIEAHRDRLARAIIALQKQ